MDTHRDDDAAAGARFAELAKLAGKMKEEGSSRITGGHPGEQPLGEWRTHGCVVRRLPDDPLCLRISVGGDWPMARPEQSAYVVYRGDFDRVLPLLERAVEALRSLPRKER